MRSLLVILPISLALQRKEAQDVRCVIRLLDDNVASLQDGMESFRCSNILGPQAGNFQAVLIADKLLQSLTAESLELYNERKREIYSTPLSPCIE